LKTVDASHHSKRYFLLNSGINPGHSVRIGAMQDLLALNIDLAPVMQAGRWKSTAMR
jgi:hypothetical protein